MTGCENKLQAENWSPVTLLSMDTVEQVNFDTMKALGIPETDRSTEDSTYQCLPGLNLGFGSTKIVHYTEKLHHGSLYRSLLLRFCLARTLWFYSAALAYLEQALAFKWIMCTWNSSLLLLCTNSLLFPSFLSHILPPARSSLSFLWVCVFLNMNVIIEGRDLIAICA